MGVRRIRAIGPHAGRIRLGCGGLARQRTAGRARAEWRVHGNATDPPDVELTCCTHERLARPVRERSLREAADWIERVGRFWNTSLDCLDAHLAAVQAADRLEKKEP